MSQSWSLHGDRRRADSFGDDAELYDRVRPPYPDELVEFLMSDVPRTVLDVGCGTGIASRLFLARGCDVLGLEPDPRMATVARRNGVDVEEGTLEAWSAGVRRFDLLVAGQSWHWVDPHLGAVKAAEVLRPGGRLGLFWNQSHPDPSVRPALQAVYERHAPELGRQSVLLGQRSDLLYESIAQAIRDCGRFGSIAVMVFGHDVAYTSEQWVELASTHSDHHTLPADQRTRLLEDSGVAIERNGGWVSVHYETTLVTGRTRTDRPAVSDGGGPPIVLS